MRINILNLIYFVGGGLFFLFLRKPIINYYVRFKSKTPTIRKYWIFVVLFLISISVAYILVFKLSSNKESLNISINILGQIASLIFAIFVGYFAFLQVIENRVDKLKEDGLRHFKERAYPRATKIYEEIHSISPGNFNILADLLELYLIQRDFDKFDKKITLLEKESLDKKDDLMVLYLKIAKNLVKEHIADVRNDIDALVELRRKHKGILIGWDFNDIKTSECYPKTGDAKLIFDNLISYLTNMTEEKKAIFESGEYTIQ